MPPAQRHDWETPPDLFDALDKEFGPFDLDPCCLPTQRTAQRILCRSGRIFVPLNEPSGMACNIAQDGLRHEWYGRVYMNPPYGREMPKWVEKAVLEVGCGNAELVVALIPARTDTKMWQRYIVQSLDWDGEDCYAACHPLIWRIRFLPGRVRFVGAGAPAPFPSAVVVWRKEAAALTQPRPLEM